MAYARLFYAVYFGIMFPLCLIELARLLFSAEAWGLKLPRFINGILFSLVWPLSLMAPAPRRHYSVLLQFVFGMKSKQIIDVKPSSKSEEDTSNQN